LTGALFKPLAFAYALSVLVSLGVALVLTPALAFVLLRNAPLERHISPLALWLQRRYEWILTRIVTRAVPVGLALWLFLLAGFIIGPRLGESLFPTFKERDFLMHWVSKPATSHPEEVRIVTRASNELRAIPGVRNFGSHIGRAIQGEEIAGVNFGENWISIDRNVDYDDTFAKIQEVVDGYPGLFRDVQTYLRERTKEVLTGASDAIVVRIFGPDIDVLREKGGEIEDLVAAVPGTRDPHLELEEDVPQLQVRVDLEAAQRFGLKPGDVRRAVGTMVAGEEVGQVFKDSKTFDVWVWSDPKVRDSPERIEDLLLDVPAGGQVRLGDLAEVAIKPTPNHLTHEGGFRRIDVGTNVQGRDLAAVSGDIQDALDKVQFETGYHAEVLGEYAERQSAQSRLIAFSLIAALAVILLLRLSFRSWRLTAMAVITLPMALVGGVIAAYYFAGGTISLGSLVGFFTVLGIVARNGIMMISHYEHLEHLEGVPFGPALVIRGAKERLAPILMTGLATGLALVPLVVKGNVPGQEIEFPLAIVILGGLLASALLNLFVLPTLYLRFGKGRGEPRHEGPLAASDRLLWVTDTHETPGDLAT
jgi:Cu/Ag efflux pump CusA